MDILSELISSIYVSFYCLHWCALHIFKCDSLDMDDLMGLLTPVVSVMVVSTLSLPPGNCQQGSTLWPFLLVSIEFSIPMVMQPPPLGPTGRSDKFLFHSWC